MMNNRISNLRITQRWGAFMQLLLQWNSKKLLHILTVFFSLRYPACNARAPYCHLQTVRLYSIIPHFLSHGTIFIKNVNEHKMCVLVLSTTSAWNVSHSKKNWKKYHKCAYLGIHVKCRLLLPDFNETWNFWTDFRKIFKYQMCWKSVQWKSSCSFRTDGHDEAIFAEGHVPTSNKTFNW